MNITIRGGIKMEKENEQNKKKSIGKRFIVILLIILILAGTVYYEFQEELDTRIKEFRNKSQEGKECYNQTELGQAYLQGASDMSNYIGFQVINESQYCNTIPIQYKDIKILHERLQLEKFKRQGSQEPTDEIYRHFNYVVRTWLEEQE